MDVLKLEMEGTVAVISMNNGKNTQDLEFARTLNSLVEKVALDESSTALVITSTDQKNWSQGINLEWMTGEIANGNPLAVRDFFKNLNQVYSQLMLMPIPTIAAINGHAFGAGAFLATACDYRIMNSERGFFCFPEIDLKMDFQPGVFSMMQHKLPDFKLPDLLFTGKHAGAVELEQSFIVEKACPGIEATVQQAMEFAGSFNKDRAIFGIYKQKLNEQAAKTMVELDLAYHERLQKNA